MNLLFKRSKKIIVAVLMFVMLIAANLTLIGEWHNTIKSVYAAQFVTEKAVSISNSNFTSFNSTNGYPYAANNFSFSSQFSTTNVKSGIVNLSEPVYKNNYEKYDLGKDDNPGLIKSNNDNYVLMINSKDGLNSCGYTSSNFEFTKNGTYYVSVFVNTSNVASASTLYLFNNDEVVAQISNINTNNVWEQFYFFVTTSDYESLKLSLGLWQGSKISPANSVVFFDSISAGQISNYEMRKIINDSTVDGKTKFTNSTGNFYYVDCSNENVIEQLDMSSTPFVVSETGNSNNGNPNYTIYSYTSMSIDGKIQSVFKVQNKLENNTCFETKSFKLNVNKVYKFSLKVKATSEDLTSGSAYMKLVEVVDDGSEESAKNSDNLTISATSNVFEDNFVEYSIIVNSDPTKVRNYKLQIGLGTSETSKAVGTAYFKDLKIASVPYSEFSGESSSTRKILDLSSDYKTSKTIANYTFDISKAVEISKENEIALNEPSDWTINKKDDTQKAGVFNVKYFDLLNKDGLTNIANPGFISSINSTTNNVLMLHNETTGVITATSTKFSLTAKSYYKISVWVNTQVSGNDQSGASLIIQKNESSDFVLSRIDNIKTVGLWKEYALYIKTGFENTDVNLVLSLGNETNSSNGYAFFDNCKATTITAEEFAKLEKDELNVIDDLTNPLAKKDKNGKPLYFDGKSEKSLQSTVGKIIDLNGDELDTVLVGSDCESARNLICDNSNVLAIHSTTEDDYYHFDTKLNYSLSSGKYYKISIDVYTAYLRTSEENAKFGASLKLSNIEESEFINVVSDKLWSTYTFFICPDSDVVTQLSLALGNSEVAAKGTVLFGNIVFEEIEDKAIYEDLIKDTKENVKVVGTVTKSDEETTPEKDKKEINWMLVTSTFTAVAVIIAVLGVAFKKMFKPSKKRVKKSKVEYDRNDSVLRQKYRRYAYLKRDKELREIEKKLISLNKEKEEKEEIYKQYLTKVREVKLNNRDGSHDKELANLNKELNKASKNVSKTGVLINKYNEQIRFMKTEAYIVDLEKQLMRQDEFAKSKGLSFDEIMNKEIMLNLENEDKQIPVNSEKAESKENAEKIETVSEEPVNEEVYNTQSDENKVDNTISKENVNIDELSIKTDDNINNADSNENNDTNQDNLE